MNLQDSAPSATPRETRALLSGRMTINEADDRRDELAKWLAGCDRLVLEVGDLEVVDTTGLQLIIALRRSAARAGKTVALAAAPTGGLLEALVAAGFRDGDTAGAPAMGQDAFWWGRS